MARTEYLPREVLESLLDTMKDTDDVDVLRETAHWLIQELIELDVSREIGADRYQRSDQRRNYSYYPEWLLERGRPAVRGLFWTW